MEVYVVWERILESDTRESALRRAGEDTDPRIRYFWDPDQLTGRAWRFVLGLRRLAWDVYYVYGPEARWTDLPPKPAFWMHQGAESDLAPFLEQTELIANVRRLAPKR